MRNKEFSILYVDDEESNLRIFKDTYRRSYNIFTASSAKAGQDILENHKIDLILSDQRMPGMSGVEFLKYALENYPEPNRILITAYSDIQAIEDAINQARVLQYVQKPWEEGQLLSIMENALRIYCLEQENKEQKQELMLARQKAEESNQLITGFLHNMSHEIRTPMNAIMGFSQLQLSEDITEAERKTFVQIVKDNATQLLRILDDILEISRLETNQIKAIKSQVCLNALFDELYFQFEERSKKQRIPLQITKELSDSESYIFTDEYKLLKILNNLLDNAFNFIQSGHVELGYVIKGKRIDIYVKDTGFGIQKEYQELIFYRFSRGEKTHSESQSLAGGLGLGLSIARENAELIGGSIKLISERNEGSTFIISLPFLIEQDNSTLKKEKIENKIKYKVLVVEDEDTNAFFLKILITAINDNITVLHANNGKEAVELCKADSEIDVVLMDIKMPVMDGYEAINLIKNLKPELPVIAQTAFASTDDKSKIIQAGFDDVITKPITKIRLNHLISKYLK